MSDDEARPATGKPRRGWFALLPLVLFAGLALLFVKGLTEGDPSKLPSALIGKPAPETVLPALEGIDYQGQPVEGFDPARLKGQAYVLNVWASWCVPCRAEHPIMLKLATQPGIRLVGLNYKDKPENAARFLRELGNPFPIIGSDQSGRAGIEWGVYGVPETFVVDAEGVIRYKFVGPLTEETLNKVLLPEIRKVAPAKAPGSS